MSPVSVLGLNDAIWVETADAYQEYSCALRRTGEVVCWGKNDDVPGQLGDGTRINRNQPVTVLGLEGWSIVALALGGNVACGLTTTKRIVCWGSNEHGELGLGHTSAVSGPVEVPGVVDVVVVRSGR